jgi:putative sigma-54 modulation protein
MQINITGHHVEVTPALTDYVNNKMEKIHRHFQHITSINVTLTVEKKHQQRAEAQIHLPKGDIHAESESENMYAAIDALIDKLDRQVIKLKEKMNNHGDGEII